MGRPLRATVGVLCITCAAFISYRCVQPQSEQAKPMLPYQDPDLPLEERVDDLVSRMTLEEKVGQTLYDAPALDRLHGRSWLRRCGRRGRTLDDRFPMATGWEPPEPPCASAGGMAWCGTTRATHSET